MKKQTTEFAIQADKGIVQQIGKSSILEPKVNYKGAGTKWFDDTKLLKTDKK